VGSNVGLLLPSPYSHTSFLLNRTLTLDASVIEVDELSAIDGDTGETLVLKGAHNGSLPVYARHNTLNLNDASFRAKNCCNSQYTQLDIPRYFRGKCYSTDTCLSYV
jgi:hypothetical protein